MGNGESENAAKQGRDFARPIGHEIVTGEGRAVLSEFHATVFGERLAGDSTYCLSIRNRRSKWPVTIL
jgi:hypothetical protein